MKKFSVIWVGKTTNKAIQSLIVDYSTRLKPMTKTDVFELKDDQSLENEAKRFLAKIPSQAFVFLLDEHGKNYTSVGFSQRLETLCLQGKSHFVFLIGSAYGFADSVKLRADETIAFSKMTFTHEMIRPFLLEQLYRAEMITRGSGYHHE
jgi:23S rRNA (pseudouridine1915-N3)-methyltransferase